MSYGPYSPYSPYGPNETEEFRTPPSMVPAAQSFARIVELPWPLVRQQQPALSVLFARGDGITSTIALHSGQDGETYSQQYVGATRFGVLATVVAEYPATAPRIDDTIGLLVDLDGDDAIEGVTDEDAAARTLLAFVGDEIISVGAAAVVAVGRLRLTGHRRGCYATPIQTHAAGAMVLFIRRDQLRPVIDASRYRAGSAWWWKLQPVFFNRFKPLAECDPLAGPQTILGTTCAPAQHANLRVNGSSREARCDWGTDIGVTWDLADWRADAFWPLISAPFIAREVGSKIEVYDADDALVRREVLGPVVSAWTYDSVAQNADFEATPASFKIRLFALWDGFASSRFEEVTVRT